MITVAAIVAGGLLLGGYFTACRLVGENLVATWWDQWCLARWSLTELDARCAANPCQSGLVVTLTTIPSRLATLAPTLKSLMRQSARPAAIRLCLPARSEREQSAYHPPPWLRALKTVTLVSCEDAGPATKFLPTLHAVGADQAVVVVDDDRIYHRRLLEAFAALASARPDEVIAGAGWSAPPDLIDRPTTLRARLAGAPYVPVRANQIGTAHRVDVVQGVHAYLIRPRFFDLAALGDFSRAPAALRFVDDVWLSAHCRVARWVHPLPMGFTDYQALAHRRHFVATSLGRNFNRAPDPAQRGNSLALRHFSDRWGR